MRTPDRGARAALLQHPSTAEAAEEIDEICQRMGWFDAVESKR